MPICKSCSAHLPKHSNICDYCGTANPIDLQGVAEYSISESDEIRYCPHCDVPMQTLSLDEEDKLQIEQCQECFGFFFDPGELEAVLDKTVKIKIIDMNKLDKANYKRVDFHEKIRYIRCPICNDQMRRYNYGYKSGVVLDRCSAHGVWLDSGELRHLMEWKSAGGEALDKRHKTEEKKVRDERERGKRFQPQYSSYHGTEEDAGSLLGMLFRFLF